MIELTVEGSIRIDSVEEDLAGRIKEFLEDDPTMDEQEARRESLGIILGENIGHTGFVIEDWYENDLMAKKDED